MFCSDHFMMPTVTVIVLAVTVSPLAPIFGHRAVPARLLESERVQSQSERGRAQGFLKYVQLGA